MRFKAKTKVNIVVETYFEAPLKGFDEKNGYKDTTKKLNQLTLKRK
jgi:ribonuclease D